MPKRLTMKPVTLVWRISDTESLLTSTETPCHKNISLFKILKSENYENSKLFGPSCPGVEDLTTRQESLFQTVKMTKSCSTETMFSSAKGLMTLEESHFQATTRPNRGFTDARYLCVQGLMSIEESHFQADKMPYRGSVNVR